MIRRLAAALVVVAVVAGCSGGTVQERPGPLLLTAIGNARTAIANRGAPAPRPQVTRALLDTVDEPVLEALRETTGDFAVLQRIVRRDAAGGSEIAVWRVPGGATLSLRDDVLIGTHGLGEDLQSSAVEPVIAALHARGGAGQRVQFVLDDDNKLRRIASACTIESLGRETLTIVERARRTERLRETCSGPQGRFVNEYWIDSDRPVIWQSRQWAGPTVGHLQLRRLKL
ncbi:MAG: YjbF family lipoprotein [Rhodobacteraceae bacterium]|nr:YjbF family lipoprotein [Paracoccaceae bacterium]